MGGFRNSLDFINMHEDKKGNKNRGYAFLNFRDHSTAARCLEALNGHVWYTEGLECPAKPAEPALATWAYVQGLEANMALAKKAASAPPNDHQGKQRVGHKKVRRQRLPFGAREAEQCSVGSSHRRILL